ncbi:general substrate transporter [Ramaria rubella]|nr:general substrate transporter [Ramaria rubella]
MHVYINKHKPEDEKRQEQRPTYSSLINCPDAKPWYTQRRRVLLNAYIAMLLLANFADGYDGSMMNGLQSLSQWEEAFNFPRGSKLALLAVIQRVGGIAVLPILPYLADGMGRRFTVFTGAAIMVLGAIVQASSHNVGTFIGARFLIGCGSAFATNSAPMLISEIAYPSQRAPLTSIFSALWQGGAMLAAWTTFGSFHINNSWAWRVPSAVQAVPGVIQMIFIFLGPESPRWLVSHGRDAEALKTLAYYHGQGDQQDPLVQYEFQEIKSALKLDGTVGWKDLVGTAGNRRRILVIVALAFFSQSGNGLVAYYLSPVFNTIGITNPFTQLLVNALLSIENVIMAVGAACLCDKAGRRTLFIISTAGMLVTFTLQTVFSSLYAQGGGTAMAHAVIAFIFLFYAAYDIAYSPLIGAYTVEIMPFALRAKGMAVSYFAMSLSFICNQYANPIALEKLRWKYYIVFCVWLVFELAFVVLFVIETKGRTLEETAVIFDGEAKVKAITNDSSTATTAAAHASILDEAKEA